MSPPGPAGEAVVEELRRYYARGGGAGRDGLEAAACWEERLARVALTRIADPGDAVMGRAVRETGAEEAVAAAREGRKLAAASPRRTEGYRLRAPRADPVADLAAALRDGGRFVCPGDGDWPAQLDDLGDQRPYGLWVRGGPSLRMWALRSVAVVGARACTDYGAHMAALLGSGLAAAGWVVVAGGVDRPYPPGNATLIASIAEHGLLVGELAPGEHPTRSRFVLRNRLIAALTRGTVVVEARHRSGSLITARRAAALGRVTMGVPTPMPTRSIRFRMDLVA